MFNFEYVGFFDVNNILYNLNTSELIELAIKHKEGFLTEKGAFVSNASKYTGRLPKSKFIVVDKITKKTIWWGFNNKRISKLFVDNFYKELVNYLSKKVVYVQDCCLGASLNNNLNIRVITERAWHSLFVKNMFIQKRLDKAFYFRPEFTIVHAPGFMINTIKSEAIIVVYFEKKLILICGTEYAGEIKKSIFCVFNYILPNKGIVGMHCSANKNKIGNVALFFGLSGTGKTTLSFHSSRILIGDDEHGWDDRGVFNFEGGCYAKIIDLNIKNEPEIYKLTECFGTILENVVINKKNRVVDLNNNKITENTRASYDISQISNIDISGLGLQPDNIIMLICDAFGVFPVISKLTQEQVIYYFISGYTAKISGVEQGNKEPLVIFSPCFGAPFLPRHPFVYTKILAEKIIKSKTSCWLINTGWIGGSYGIGKRVPIKQTRILLTAIFKNQFRNSKFKIHPIFKVLIPDFVNGISSAILNPKNIWKNKKDYNKKAQSLRYLFFENFKTFGKYV